MRGRESGLDDDDDDDVVCDGDGNGPNRTINHSINGDADSVIIAKSETSN